MEQIEAQEGQPVSQAPPAAQDTQGAPVTQDTAQLPPAVQEAAKGDTQPTQEQQAYVSGLMKMLHAKETSPAVVKMLSSAPPEQSIPQTALTINQNFEQQLKGKKPSLETSLVGGVYLVKDLILIGNTAKVFNVPEEGLGPILKTTMQKYVEAGLKDGSIDPIELQKKTEPLMTEEQRAQGLSHGEKLGIPQEPGTRQAMETYASQRVRKSMLKGAQ
jgi:hypothetical protein